MKRHLAPLFALVLFSVFWGGCVTRPGTRLERQVGESLVFIGDQPAALAHLPAPGQPVKVWNAYEPAQRTVEYLEGRDFAVDYSAGTLRRLPGSRLPDFRANILFGQEDFDHGRFPGFGNAGYFAWVDYACRPGAPWPIQPSQAQFLTNTQHLLKSGKPVKILAFGDSITAGGDASKPGLVFWQRWADGLKRQYPRAQVSALNGATGGDSTVHGLQRLQAKVIDQEPDLVLVGFGMNDHNLGGVPIPQFEKNLKEIIARVRNEMSADLILFSAFPPNPKWKFGTHRMPEYAAATARVAQQEACAYADVFNNWQALAGRKKPEDFLGNNINHPNDFGHWIYFQVLQELGL